MGWQDREYAGDDRQSMGRPGGDWQGLRTTIDNPFSWSLRIMRVAGITVRVHLFFLLFVVIMILRALATPAAGSALPDVGIMGLTMVVLFGIVLLHEFGHCFAARWAGGEADEILMWPLGGLAFTRPPHHWKAHFMTVAGGPLVNVIICLIAGAALGLLTGIWWRVAIPNPLDPFAGLWEIGYSWPLIALYLINALSLLLLLFNLLPIFPLDGGRLVQSLLWPRYGYTRSMRFAVRAGYVGAIVLFIYGAVTDTMMLVFIALFGAFTCYMTHKQLQWTDETMGFESDEYALSLHAGAQESASPEPAISRRAQKQLEREQQESQEVDRILQKIADSGMDSLTRGERALLKRYTERKRQQQE